MRRPRPRAGYTTVLALLLIVLFLCLWGVAYRQTAAVLRMETVQANRVQRDQGPTLALAQALRLLETGVPPTSPYVGSVQVTGASGSQQYTVTFTQQGPNTWAVQASGTPSSTGAAALPATFAP